MDRVGHTVLLILTAFIWGTAFVAQSVGLDYIGPFTLNGLRFFIGGLVLLPLIPLLDRFKHDDAGNDTPKNQSDLFAGGICCGIVLAIASTLQQLGIQYTAVGKAGFITALYIVIVPLLGLLLGRRVRLLIGVSVLLSLAGLYFLCMKDRLAFGLGDGLVLLSAFFFSVHILVIDFFSTRANGVRMSCIQFFTAGVLLTGPILIVEKPDMAAILDAWMPLLYTGVLSSGVAYTLQIIAQRDYDPTVASLLLSLESVFSVLAGWIVLGQSLSPREIFGCLLMFCAVVLAQLPSGKKKLHDKKPRKSP